MDKGKLKRQIEILAMVLPDNRDRIDVLDLSMKFGTGEATINRDLSDLRNSGVDIHSTAGDGIVITGETKPGLIKELLNKFIGSYYSDNLEEIISRQTGDEDAVKFFERIVLLNMAIDTGTKAEIKLKNSNYSPLVEPVLIKLVKNEWIVILISGDTFTHHKITDIERVRNKKGRCSSYNDENLDKYIEEISKSGTDEKHFIKLLFAAPLNGQFPKHLIKSHNYQENPDGSVVLKGECGSLEEIAKWIISNGDLTKDILEPRPLLDMVITKAKEILDLYGRSVVFEPYRQYINDGINISELPEPHYSISIPRVDSKKIAIPDEDLVAMESAGKYISIKYYTPPEKDYWEYPYPIDF